jgi:hypothetical protein
MVIMTGRASIISEARPDGFLAEAILEVELGGGGVDVHELLVDGQLLDEVGEDGQVLLRCGADLVLEISHAETLLSHLLYTMVGSMLRCEAQRLNLRSPHVGTNG